MTREEENTVFTIIVDTYFARY